MAKLASAAHLHLRVLELPGATLTALKEAPEGFRLTGTTPPPRPGSAWSSWRWDSGEIQTEDCSESLSLCGPAAGEQGFSFTALLGGKELGDSRSAHTGDREQLPAKATAPVLQHLSGGDHPRGVLRGS